MATLWTACEHYLKQACDLVGRLSECQYDVAHANCFGATIGGHVRHCAEHFESFRAGLKSGKIDYDARKRGTPDEKSPDEAAKRLCELSKWFSDHAGERAEEDGIEVKVDCGGGSECAAWQGSSIGRELQFLVSHTVHHFAIIGIMCEAQGIELAPDFGFAPSTLKHRESEARTA